MLKRMRDSRLADSGDLFDERRLDNIDKYKASVYSFSSENLREVNQLDVPMQDNVRN